MTVGTVMDTKDAIRLELQRVEEDCTYSGKAHFNASDRWGSYHLWLGVPAVLVTTLAGTTFLTDQPAIAGGLSMLAAILTALVTFLKPSERALAHKSSGDQYLILRNDARVLRTVRLNAVPDEAATIASLDEVVKRRNELNQVSPQFARRDFEKARKGIEEGEARHAVDTEKG